MSFLSTLPEHYGWVIASGAFCGVALTITGTLAGLKRKSNGVKYPNLYASDITAEKDPKAAAFNCARNFAFKMFIEIIFLFIINP